MRTLLIALSFVGAFGVSPARADATADLFATCAACHGEKGEGNAELKAPPIAGQAESYLKRQLDHFRAGLRGYDEKDEEGQLMKAQAEMLEDGQVAVIARYVATLPKPARPAATKGNASNGGDLFPICAACHGQSGEGQEAMHAPALDHLPAWYITAQMDKFRAGHRGAKKEDKLGQQMKDMADVLSGPADVDDILAYLTSLGK